MRHAADPCLGFYLPSEPSRALGPVLELPPIVSIGPDDDCSSDDGGFQFQSTVTVDGFLRRSAPAKTYGRKGKRNGVRSKDDRDISVNHTDDDSEESSYKPSPSHQRAEKPHRQYRPLKKRLLSAAVLSHTEPDEWLFENDAPAPQTRHPLSLVETQPTCGRIRLKRRTWRLVDPSKALLPRFNSFSAPSKLSAGSAPKVGTLSGWQPYVDGGAIPKNKVQKSSKIVRTPSQCLPLAFVPLHDAEKSYSLMRMHCKPLATISKSKVSAIESPKRYVPLDFPSASEYTSFSKPSNSAIAHSKSQQKLPSPAHPLAWTSISPDMSQTATHPPHVLTPSKDRLLQSPTHLSFSSAPDPKNYESVASLSHSRGSDEPPRSTLRPLASFFDQFLQTARSETHSEQNMKRKAPGKVSPTQLHDPQHVKAHRRSHARPTARRAAHSSDSRLSSPFAPKPRTGGEIAHCSTFPPPPSSLSSPDIHAVLRTPYQVILPSTPPTPRNDSTLCSTAGIDQHIAIDPSINLFCFV